MHACVLVFALVIAVGGVPVLVMVLVRSRVWVNSDFPAFFFEFLYRNFAHESRYLPVKSGIAHELRPVFCNYKQGVYMSILVWIYAYTIYSHTCAHTHRK